MRKGEYRAPRVVPSGLLFVFVSHLDLLLEEYVGLRDLSLPLLDRALLGLVLRRHLGEARLPLARLSQCTHVRG